MPEVNEELALRMVARIMNEPIHWYKQGATTAVSNVYEKDYIRDSVAAKQAIDESEYFGPKFSAITWEEAQQILAVSDDEDGYFNVVCCLMITKIECISGGLQKGLDVAIKSTNQVISVKLNAKTPYTMLVPGIDAPLADLTAAGHGVQLRIPPGVRVAYQVAYWKKDQLVLADDGN